MSVSFGDYWNFFGFIEGNRVSFVDEKVRNWDLNWNV